MQSTYRSLLRYCMFPPPPPRLVLPRGACVAVHGPCIFFFFFPFEKGGGGGAGGVAATYSTPCVLVVSCVLCLLCQKT